MPFLTEEDLASVAEEHTAPSKGEELGSRRISVENFLRAHDVLGQLVCNYGEVIESGKLNMSSLMEVKSVDGFDLSCGLSVAQFKTESLRQTAVELQDTIGAQIFPE